MPVSTYPGRYRVVDHHFLIDDLQRRCNDSETHPDPSEGTRGFHKPGIGAKAALRDEGRALL